MFWKLNCTSAYDVDGRGVAAAGSSGVEVGTCVVGRDVKSAWIHGNFGVRVSSTSCIHFTLILSLVDKFFAQFIAFRFSPSHGGPRCCARPCTIGQRTQSCGCNGWQGWRGRSFANSRCRAPSVGWCSFDKFKPNFLEDWAILDMMGGLV